MGDPENQDTPYVKFSKTGKNTPSERKKINRNTLIT